MLTRFRATMRGFRRQTRAAAMVEFAIVAPLLFILIFGIIDFGRVFFLYNNLTNAARDGARLAAVQVCNNSVDAGVITATKDRINDAGKTAAFASGGASVEITRQNASPATTVRVKIQNYPFAPVTFLVIKAAKQLNVQAEFRCEQQP